MGGEGMTGEERGGEGRKENRGKGKPEGGRGGGRVASRQLGDGRP